MGSRPGKQGMRDCGHIGEVFLTMYSGLGLHPPASAR
jgi:hypothetical protein